MIKRIAKTFIVILAITAVLFISFAIGFGYGVFSILTPRGGQEVVIDIPTGLHAGQIAEKLQSEGAITDAGVFKVIVRLTKSGDKIKPGRYRIDPGDSMIEILNRLKTGSFDIRLVTIPEGLTINQIAALLQEKDVVEGEKFRNAVKTSELYINGEKIEKPEGYLLPETYDIPEYYTPDQIVKLFFDTFETNVLPLYDAGKDSLPVKLSLSEVVVLASMVEREAQVPAERPLIAGVYYNRLKKGMKLECDATVQYALGKHKEVLKYSDLEVDSPYNTYRYKGLPPGAIANPGMDSIRAALEPEASGYLYYVRNDIKNDGSHVFSETYDQHLQAIKKYLK